MDFVFGSDLTTRSDRADEATGSWPRASLIDGQDCLTDDLCEQWQQREPLSAPLIEKELCAAMLRADDTTLNALRIAVQSLQPKNFVVPIYRTIADLAVGLLDQNQVPSFSAIHNLARSRNIDLGGTHYLTDLANDPTVRYCTPLMFEQSCDALNQLALKRDYRSHLTDQLAQLSSRSLPDSLQQTEDMVGLLARQIDSGQHAPVHIMDTIEPILDRLVNNDGKTGPVIQTGFAPLDNCLGGGLRAADYVLIGARPSMGKTALALNLAENVGRLGLEGRPVPTLFFELEMTRNALGTRALSSRSAIKLQKLRTGDLNDSDLHELLDAVHFFQKPGFTSAVGGHGSELWVVDQSGLTLQEIRAIARKFVREFGPSLIVIDYLQLIAPPTSSRGIDANRHISAVSAGLKALGKELSSPVIALSQLNRSLEHRACKRPILADLRESGSLEQDADIIIFLYRDNVYHPDSSDPTEAELIIAKQRDGAIGVLPMRYQGDIVKFEMGPAFAR